MAWSLPAFRPGDWRNSSQELDRLAELGFRHVVLHPTFPVTEDLSIGSGPDPEPVVSYARSLGLSIRLEPHLDYATALSGGPYRWRREMLIDPAGEYLSRVLLPLSDLVPNEFTLGSELDWSVDAYPESWLLVRERFRALRTGHKLNHDWLAGERAIDYLRALDYVSLSWYVPDLRPLPEGYVIGELGLGSSDVSRPWHFDAQTLRTPEALAVRRAWYLALIDWLRNTQSPGAAAFWTAGQFDVLGVRHQEWRDDAIVEAIRAYNSPHVR